jgi:hypothetical protein
MYEANHLQLQNFMFYGLSNFANPWVADNGPERKSLTLFKHAIPGTLLPSPSSISKYFFDEYYTDMRETVEIMFVFGGTSIFIAILGFPVYIFGKRLRGWWARHDLFKILKMETSGPVSAMG